MGLYPSLIGEITLAAGINPITASGYQTVGAILKAHPSNSGILYVRQTATAGTGFPLNPGETLNLSRADLHEYSVSGVAGQRLAWISSQ